MTEAQNILEVRNLCKSFGAVRAVDRVSFAVKKGELSSIIGPNGAGKTTLFNLITGLLPADGGNIQFRRKEITSHPAHEIARIGLGRSFQVENTFHSLTAFKNVQAAVIAKQNKGKNIFASASALSEVNQRVEQILSSVKLLDKAEVLSENLSHGDQKFLDIAITLAQGPEMILLDEPTAGMAPDERLKTMELIQHLWETLGLTILFVEHDMDLVFSISQVIRVLHQGRLIAEGGTEVIKKNEEVRIAYLGD
jgi:branched-chain amino acid transport system ATP-binding protein